MKVERVPPKFFGNFSREINRRDFLKLLGIGALGTAAPQIFQERIDYSDFERGFKQIPWETLDQMEVNNFQGIVLPNESIYERDRTSQTILENVFSMETGGQVYFEINGPEQDVDELRIFDVDFEKHGILAPVISSSKRKSVLLHGGYFSAGEHLVTVGKTADSGSEFEHDALSLSVVRGEEGTLVDTYRMLSPYIYPRPQNLSCLRNDPMLDMSGHIMENESSYLFVYMTYFGDEDGGMSLEERIEKYGRRMDVEPAMAIKISKDSGLITDIRYQAAGHEILPFNGQWVGSHPCLQVATLNNNFSELIISPRPFALVPDTQPTTDIESNPVYRSISDLDPGSLRDCMLGREN